MKISTVSYFVSASSTVGGKLYKDNVHGFCVRVKPSDEDVLPRFCSMSDGATFCLTMEDSIMYYPQALLLPDGDGN